MFIVTLAAIIFLFFLNVRLVPRWKNNLHG